MELETITERIQYLISKSSYSKTEIAERAGMSKQSLYKYEKGLITNIPSDRIEALAYALNSTPAFIMGWDEQRIDELQEAQKELNAKQDAIEIALMPLFELGLTEAEANEVINYARFIITRRCDNE